MAVSGVALDQTASLLSRCDSRHIPGPKVSGGEDWKGDRREIEEGHEAGDILRVIHWRRSGCSWATAGACLLLAPASLLAISTAFDALQLTGRYPVTLLPQTATAVIPSSSELPLWLAKQLQRSRVSAGKPHKLIKLELEAGGSKSV